MFKQYKYYFWLHFTILIWGFTGVIGKMLTNHDVSSTAIVFYRIGIGFLALLIYLLISGKGIKLPAKGVASTMGVGLIIAAHWITFFLAIEMSNVSTALVCFSTTAIFTSFIEPIILKSKYDYRESIMGVIVVLGIGIIMFESSQHIKAMLCAILSAFLAASFSVINAKLIKSYSSAKITLYELLGGFIGTSAYLLIDGRLNAEELVVTPEAFGWLFILGAICTAFAFLMGVEIVKYIPVFTVNITINLEPIYAMILAIIFFGGAEVMSGKFYLGTAIIIGVIILNSWVKKRGEIKGST